MKKSILTFFLIWFLSGFAFGQSQAVIREITGKVEVRPPQAGWLPAREGMILSLGAVISTGFNSRAVLDLGRSVLQVDPLTRLRIDELIEKEGTVQTALFLRVGKVKAEVKSVTGVTQDFKLRSPVSTAAVRGTSLGYDGFSLEVFSGDVYYVNLLSQERSYSSGENGSTQGYNPLSSSENSKDEKSSVNPYTLGDQSGNLLPSGSDIGLTGGIVIVVDDPFGGE